MELMDRFINRNKDSYIKISDVPQELIAKYKDIVPQELIYIWQTMGFGIFEDGFLQLVNPDEYEFVFHYVDKMLEPAIIFGITALGEPIAWEGGENWTVAPDEGNRCYRIDIRSCDRLVIDNIEGVLNIFIEYGIEDKDYFNSKEYVKVKNKLPKLKYGECYGYVPALVLGGKKSLENMQIVDAKAYITVIGEATGKIFQYGNK